MDSTANSKISPTPQPTAMTMSAGKSVTNCPKMGSRRIFTPQFKLQVLESYRNDHDCKGNQRATARKYNIHRRQIQKWLQCEASLRSSVVNINQNAVKHQFHNVSMQQQQQQQQTKNVAPTQNIANGLTCSSNHLQTTHLCLETPTKGCTMHKTMEVPSSLTSSLSVTSSCTTQETRADILTTVNDISTASTVVSPLRPSAIMSAVKNSTASLSPLLHHHHHHHYGLQTFSNITAPSTVPILVHHLNNTQQIYQYDNIHYPPPSASTTLSHHHHQQANEKDHATYLPTMLLPPPTTAANNTYTLTNNERFDMLLLGAKTYTKTLYNSSHPQPYHSTNSLECSTNATRFENPTNTNESFRIQQFTADSAYAQPISFAPMDLSLRHNKQPKTEPGVNITNSSYQITTAAAATTPVKKSEIKIVADVVDLTYRKRRVANTNNNSNNEYNHEYHEKQQKLSTNFEEADPANLSTNCNEDDDIEIEVGTEEKFPPTSSKPVKLFKPYLLDEYEDNNDDNHHHPHQHHHHLSSNNNNKALKNHLNEEEIMKQHNDTFTSENTFPEAVKENINICMDNSSTTTTTTTTNFFVESRSESPRSVCSPATYVSTLSPTNFQYSKGSPAASSGYESSTSTYSDTSLSSKADTSSYTYGQTTYSLNLQMQTIYHENNNNIHNVIHPTKHVQRWLEKDDSNSLETNSSIALFV